MAANQPSDTEFPCTLTISLPLPSHRLASSAMRALEVDAELSPHVRRYFVLKSPDPGAQSTGGDEGQTVLETTYKATTNRMLRVAVNGFMESLGVVLGVMEELDVDVLKEGGDE
ncbi:CTAG/PCC1 family protein [Aspergillus foveolatus]|uniref:CTAG/PCC1 family protein n=1 Tax=Aspergillus foveolatus TaxID=210207 RepID=UPI003CCCE03F